MRCSVEISIVVRGLIQDLDVAIGCWAPVDERKQGRRVRLEDSAVLVETTKNGCTDRKDDARWVVTRGGEYVMDQPSMQSAVSIDERMHVNEAECDSSSGRDRVDMPAN